MRAYDDAAAIFTGPAGEMVRASDGPTGVTHAVYAPAREASPVRFEYDPDADRWIEHDPLGIKRYYGSDLQNANSGRIRNELGTHAWLLVEEIDRNGNFITYAYHNAGEANRRRLRTAQRMPILSRVEWGGNTKTHVSPMFYVQTAIAPQSLDDYAQVYGQTGPINLLEGNTRLDDRVTSIDVGVEGSSVWSYTLDYITSETGKTLLSKVARGGDGGEETSFNYLRGAPVSGPRFVDKGLLSPNNAPIYENNSRFMAANAVQGIDPRIFWHGPARHTAEAAVQAPAFRSAVKFIDVDGNGTTDAIYHASGIGTTETHVLWDDSVLQSPSASGIGAWNVAPAGDGSIGAVQPTTGLPAFPFGGNWNRSDFATSALHDLVDLDGDGDADALAFPFTLQFVNAPRVLDPTARVTHVLPQGPAGSMNLRVFTNTARDGTVQHAANQVLADWPVDPTWGFQTGHLHSMVLATSGRDPDTSPEPLRYKVEPVNDLQMPLVDLNADGRPDLVLTKRRHQHANYIPPGAPNGAIAGVGAYAMPANALVKLFYGGASRPEGQIDGPALGGPPMEITVRHDIAEGAIVLVDDDLLKSLEQPPRYTRIFTTAENLLIPDVPPTMKVALMSMPGVLPGGGLPGVPPREDGLPNVPTPGSGLEWWHPQIDPEGDVYLPLRDAYDIGGSLFGFKMFLRPLPVRAARLHDARR